MDSKTHNKAQAAIARMFKARTRYEEAAKALMKATQEAFPIGSIVDVTMGRARVRGKVVSAGSGCWWSSPSQVTIENIKTGKYRSFCATYRAHEVIVIGRSVRRKGGR